MQDIVYEVQDLTHLDWSESETSSATGGSYLKARTGEGCTATYFKLSCYDEINGVYGHECVNELIASRLMSVLCVEHVPYRLVHARVMVNGMRFDTWLSESKSFRSIGESKVSLARFYSWNHLEGENRIDFCRRFGWMRDVQQTMLIDYLIANRDRHGGNLEVLKDRSGKVRLAPLFDNGLSLCYSSFSASQVRAIDPLQDIIAHNYLGSRSLEGNLLRFVPNDLAIGRLQESHADEITHGIEPALDEAIEGMSGRDFSDVLWHMIWERWRTYESFRDSGCLQTEV